MALDHLSDENLQDYIEHNLDNRSEIRAHLSSCPDCRRKLAEYEKLYSNLAVEPKFELSVDFAKKVAAAVQEDSAEKILFKFSRAVIWLVGIAACLFSIWYFSDKKLLQNSLAGVEGSGQNAFNLTLQSFQNLFQNFGLNLNLVLMVILVVAAIALIDRLVVRARKTATMNILI